MQDTIHKTITDILEILSLPHESVQKSDTDLLGNITFEIETNQPSFLIGKDGHHLQALTTIVRKIVHAKAKKHDRSPPTSIDFFIDVDGYKREKVKAVQRKAYMMAGRAKRYQRDVAMQPMNAYKRMIVHQTLEGEEEVITESSGRGDDRHVVIYCKE